MLEESPAVDRTAQGVDSEGYWNDRLSQHFTLGGVGWLGLSEPLNRWMYRVRRDVFLRAARPLVNAVSDPVALDIGAGTGFYTALWIELGARPTASDLTSVAVSRLSDRYPGIEVVKMDVTAEDGVLGGRSFDLVSAMDVLFHILDGSAYERAISNLRSLVKPGGYLVLSENRMRRGEQRGDRQVSRSAETIDRLLHEAGFRIVSRRPMFVLMNTPVNSDSRLLGAWWEHLTAMAGRRPRAGGILGALVYPVERVLVRVVRGGPSTELLVCEAQPRSGT
jgi:SAM-dependent methyltransferase